MTDNQTTQYKKGQLYNIDLAYLLPDPNQPRKFMDPTALEELTASIKQHGVLEPILFRQNTDGVLYIVAGERRFAAAQNAGLTAIPAIFIEGNYAEISLVENLLRQDLTAVEEAEALKGLMDGQQYTQEQLSAIIGKARSTITEILTLNRLPEEIRSECRSNPAVSRATLLQIARNKQTRSMLTQYKKYKEKLAKQQAGKQAKVKTAPAQALTELLEKTTEKLSDLDATNLTDAEKTTLSTAMTHLKTTISTALKSVTQKPKPVPNI
jgi:ParB family transcriptional regulator, chromosome partitioning protein